MCVRARALVCACVRVCMRARQCVCMRVRVYVVRGAHVTWFNDVVKAIYSGFGSRSPVA